jgi:cytosine/adenosine deaminase-related metal-dependent hydrolase
MSSAEKSSNEPAAFRARWVFPVDRPPIEGGIITISGGRIVAVGEKSSGPPPRDLGDVALLPGLVNAHTHLEFSALERPLGEAGMAFPQWIQRVVEHRKQRMKKILVETDGLARFQRVTTQAGLHELRQAGVVAAGEIASPDWSLDCFHAPGVRLVLFQELLGLAPQDQQRLMAKAQSFVAEVYDAGLPLRPGLSPHAPYTVSPELLRKTCLLSAAEHVPVAMHLAESREELELLRSCSGALVEFLRSLKAWYPEELRPGARPLDYLKTLATAHHSLVVHGNYLARDEIEFLGAHRDRLSLVYCPRTHAYFKHDPYPLNEILNAGVRVAVGTDSRASNPDLRLFEELRHIVHHHRQVAPEAILRMGTLVGAETLGLADQLGTITPGKKARLAVVPVERASKDPYEELFASAGSASLL